jgi:hypothetical protein
LDRVWETKGTDMFGICWCLLGSFCLKGIGIKLYAVVCN